MGRCITIITLGGVTSLGLLTGSLALESFSSIPEFIRSLNNQDSVHSQEGQTVLKSIKTHLSISNVVNVVLAALSTSAFRTAFKYSGRSAKHPYLIYSALGAPLALLALFYKGGKPLVPLTEDLKNYCGGLKTSKKGNKTDAGEPTAASAEALESSYVNISESSSSDSSAETPEDSLSNSAYSIEEEVENALKKKERLHELDNIRSAFGVASYIAGAAFAISTVGFLGDRYFI